MTLLAETTRRTTSSSDTTSLTVLLGALADPVDARVVADDLVRGIDKNHLKVLERGVLVDPVRVEHTEVSAAAGSPLLGQAAKVAGPLETNNTVAGGLATSATTGDGALATTTAHANPVDHVALLGLVAETASLVRTSGAGRTVDRGSLAEEMSSISQHLNVN